MNNIPTANIKWIPIKNLNIVWASAQRPLDEIWRDKICDNFDPDVFGILDVTRPNGEGIYHIIDGQHRKSAAEKLYGQNEQLPCRVLEAVKEFEAAEKFLRSNSQRKSIKRIDSFRIAVIAERKTEVAINKLILKMGYRVAASQEDKCIGCVDALVQVFTRYGEETLKLTLMVLQATWGMDKNATNAHLVRGYGLFFSQYAHAANLQIVKEVIAKKFTPGRLITQAKALREGNEGSIPEQICNIIFAAYNRRIRGDKKLVR